MLAERRRQLALALLALMALTGQVDARPWDAVKARGALSLCAHPDALPFASRLGPRPGFQVEIAEALAERLGLQLVVDWVIVAVQYRRVDCDIIMDTILEPDTLAERRIHPSIPSQRSGVLLALREAEGAPPASLEAFGKARKIGVQVGSLTQVSLGRQGYRTSPFALEDEMMKALASGEIDAAATSASSVGWWNFNHPEARFATLTAFGAEPELRWLLTVGMRRSDTALREAIDEALAGLLQDGTITRIDASYGIEHRPPV